MKDRWLLVTEPGTGPQKVDTEGKSMAKLLCVARRLLFFAICFVIITDISGFVTITQVNQEINAYFDVYFVCYMKKKLETLRPVHAMSKQMVELVEHPESCHIIWSSRWMLP
jgi:hypothetical protein